jgi:hypothetical protein
MMTRTAAVSAEGIFADVMMPRSPATDDDDSDPD